MIGTTIFVGIGGLFIIRKINDPIDGKTGTKQILYSEGIFYGDGSNRRNSQKIKWMAKDSYGRQMYRYTVRQGESMADGLQDYYDPYRKLNIFVIIQKQTEDTVFCYSGESIFIDTDEDKTALTQFKAKNDWGKPMNDAKMTAYDYHIREISEQRSDWIQKKHLVSLLGEKVDKTFEFYCLGAVYDNELNSVYVLRDADSFNAGQSDIVDTYAFQVNEQGEISLFIRLEGDPNEWIKQVNAIKTPAQ